MKILFAIDPWIYRDSVGNQMYTYENILKKTINELKLQKNDVKVLIGEDMYFSINKTNKCETNDFIVIPLKDLYDIYPNHYQAHDIQFKQKETLKQKEKTKLLIEKNMNGWIPEIVISFTTPASVWKYVFPNCLSLQFENGIFSRTPYPYLCQLDPFGFLKETYPYKFENQIKNEELTKQELNRITNLIDVYLKQIFKKKNPIRKEDIADYDGQKILLVPLSYNGVIINDASSKFRSQLDFLIHVMENVPSNIKVIATRHSLQMNGSIPKETEEFLLNKYKNLSFVYNLEKYAFLSQWLTPLVDGVISLNSTVAFHAALYGKIVIALGDCEINTVSTDNNLKKISKYINQENCNKNSLKILYRLLTRDCFLLKKLQDGKWLSNRLKRMLEVHRNGNLYKYLNALPLVDDNEEKIFEELIKEAPGIKEDFVPRVR